MNQKQAKKLRRQAERETIGKRWSNPNLSRVFDPMTRQQIGVKVEHTDGCGRGKYHAAKKEFLNGSR